MSYEKHTWVGKEVIKAKNLNHMEDGIYNEEQRATNAETLISQSVTNENTRATNAEGALSNRVTATESAITTLNGSDQVVGSVDYKISQAMSEMGGYKVVADHTAVVNPSNKFIYLEPDLSSTATDIFSEWIWIDLETPGVFDWHCTGEKSLDLSDYIKNTDFATTSTPGIVIVDGTTITINNGVITANVAGGVTGVKGDSESNYRTGNVNITKANIGLSDVGNFKAVSTVASQGLSSTEQANARVNIGAGTSSFSGSYNDLSNKPSIPTNTSDLTNDSDFVADASYVHTDNNFTTTLKDKLDGVATGAEVNVQSDWNESDNTSDAYIANKPTLFSGNYNDLSNKPTLGTAAALDVATSGDASTTQVVKGDDSRLTDSRTPTSHTHTTSQITDFPTLGTAATLDVATTGDASSSQVVKGDDSRLSDARTPTSHTHTTSDITNFPTIPGGVKSGTTRANATDTTLYFIRS